MGVFDSETWTRADPRLRAQLSALFAGAQSAGHNVGLGNAWRSHERQKHLYATKPGLAAEPGDSNHEFGLAADLTFGNAAARQWVHQNAAQYGMWFPMDYEPWHVQLVGIDRHNIGNPNAQIGGGRDAFSQSPDMRFINPYDRMQQAMDQEDPYDPLEQFGRLVQMFSSGGDDMGLLESPDASMLTGSPEMSSPSMEPEELVGAVSGTADPTAAVAKPEVDDGN